MHIIKEYISKCEKCGKEFIQYVSDYHITKGKVKKYCCRSCANSHTTKHLQKEYRCKVCGKVILKDYRTDPKNIICSECRSKHVEKICIICGKIYHPTIKGNGKLSKSQCCSDECKIQLRKNTGLKAYKQAKEKGITKPWQSRKITSYPEKFWIEVLNNNNIEFEREYFFDKKYFLDFYIVVNDEKIDLEIDGKQHQREEHIEHDAIRDEYIKSKGLHVYRIPWNEINSDSGKMLMKEKIDNFLVFYNNITG